jgi:hypothetical protein
MGRLFYYGNQLFLPFGRKTDKEANIFLIEFSGNLPGKPDKVLTFGLNKAIIMLAL